MCSAIISRSRGDLNCDTMTGEFIATQPRESSRTPAYSAFRRSRGLSQRLTPAACPRLSLTFLNWSRSMKRERKLGPFCDAPERAPVRGGP